LERNLLQCYWGFLLAERKRPLGRPKRRWEDFMKLDHTEIVWGGIDWINLAQDREQWWALLNTVMNIQVSQMLENS
jgi:hypothetical protein